MAKSADTQPQTGLTEELTARTEAVLIDLRDLTPPREPRDGLERMKVRAQIAAAVEAGDPRALGALLGAIAKWIESERIRLDAEYKAARVKWLRREARLIQAGRPFAEGAIVGGQDYFNEEEGDR